MSGFEVSKLAVPAVCILICLLAYSSQLLFLQLDPGPLSLAELIKFNSLLVALWICYYRACRTDPGRVPQGWSPAPGVNEGEQQAPEAQMARQRWCRKCETYKPPRAHHCKTCGRCIPKMDHHCPWTRNCVSHFTFPHFIRFLFYAVAAMCYLGYFLFLRCAVIWQERNMPRYLGPSTSQLVHLFLLVVINFLTLALVSITLARTVWGLGGNVTTIESWEIERHERLLRRARALGGYLDGPDGLKVRIERQEFPYDIGIWKNIQQGMGGGSFLTWWWPFSGTPVGRGLMFATNGFEDASKSWPPPDPDRIPRIQRPPRPSAAFTFPTRPLSAYEEMEAFKKRQDEDLQRRQNQDQLRRRVPFHKRHSSGPLGGSDDSEVDGEEDDGQSGSGEEGWQDSGGNRLKDYGVDEEVEFYDEDDVPLSELLRRRRAEQS